MPRLLTATTLAILLSPAAQADGPAGVWKFRFSDGGIEPVTFLINLAPAAGEFVGSSAKLKEEPKVTNVEVTADAVRFTLTFAGKEFIAFDGVPGKDGKKVVGSYSQFGSTLRLTELYPSRLGKQADPFDLARESAAQLDAGQELFDAGFTVVGGAGAKKLPADEVRGLADKLGRAAAGYGPRWERTVAARLAAALADQDGYADLAVAQARRAERLLGDDAPPAATLASSELLARVLLKAGKPDEAAKYAAAAGKMEARDYADYSKTALGFTPERFKGRKGSSDRAALVEVFTGAECPPCVAVDLAFDALLQTYKPADVILLQYHFHVPAPDPLTSPDGLDRVGYYADSIKGAPTVFLSGKAGPRGGGPAAVAKERYDGLRESLDALLEKPAGAKLTLAVAKADAGYTATATVADLDAPGANVALRFVLAEERVRYTGGNGIRYHHHIVRALPGGAKGFPLPKKTAEQTVTFDPAALRGTLTKYLDEASKTDGEFPRADRPLALRDLKLVAFVQNDETGEVLQAVQADVGK